jgi:geranylgeranyl reductase family protein
VTPEFDVAIVGAGPAGAWTAHVLARRGARVLLVDPSHPREKPCGGGVTARALRLVADAVDGGRLPAVTIRSARFTTSSSPQRAEVTLRDRALSVASRSAFDGLLFDSARRSGARTLVARVTNLRSAPGGFELETTAGTRRAGVLVGADGANSLVRRRLAAPFRRDQLSIATGFFAHDVTSDQIAIEFVADPPGYVWSFPRPGHLAVGICAQADHGATAADLRAMAADWMSRTHTADGARLTPYSWPVPSLSQADFESLQPAGPGWFLVGDAAGLVDPITREGIYFALLSAEWAADTITTARSWQQYAARVREEIGGELALAARLKSRFYRPHFTRLLIDALRRSASVRDVMADLVSGEQGYRDLKWRLAKTLQIGLASRVFFSRIRRPREAGCAVPASSALRAVRPDS